MKYNKTVLVLYTEPTEAFTDLVKFCKVKGANYNTMKQKKFPIKFKGAILEKEDNDSREYIKRYGELIEIQ